MLLIIREQDGVVARVENYQGPLPRAGECIFHPPTDDDGWSDLSVHGTDVMSVKTVTYGIITRSKTRELDHFVGRPLNVVEVWV